jgi:hypothetical protein
MPGPDRTLWRRESGELSGKRNFSRLYVDFYGVNSFDEAVDFLLHRFDACETLIFLVRGAKLTFGRLQVGT